MRATRIGLDGRTTCCGAFTSISMDDGVEYCKACYAAVEGTASARTKVELPRDRGAAGFRKGDKVIGLGRGGAAWRPRPVGTVTDLVGGRVRVQWDDSAVEDDMAPGDLLRARGRVARPASDHERNHDHE